MIKLEDVNLSICVGVVIVSTSIHLWGWMLYEQERLNQAKLNYTVWQLMTVNKCDNGGDFDIKLETINCK